MTKRLFASWKKSIDKGKPVRSKGCMLVTWYVVSKQVESPDSDRIFSDDVGVLRAPAGDLKMPYRERPILVLVAHARARSGAELRSSHNGRPPYLVYTKLRPIDYAHKVLGAWDDQ